MNDSVGVQIPGDVIMCAVRRHKVSVLAPEQGCTDRNWRQGKAVKRTQHSQPHHRLRRGEGNTHSSPLSVEDRMCASTDSERNPGRFNIDDGSAQTQTQDKNKRENGMSSQTREM